MVGFAVTLLLVAGAAISGCGDESGPPATRATTTTEPPTGPPPSQPGGYGSRAPGNAEDGDDGAAGAGDEAAAAPARGGAEREVAGTVRAYLLGLDAGDGGRVCALLAPGAIDEVELPERRSGCGASLTASIGYRDPRGLPVFESLRLAGIRAIAVEGRTARARATTVTSFSDRDEPSIEDDVVHLVRDDGAWLIAKPSATLYRAVGIADVPPSVLAPPGG